MDTVFMPDGMSTKRSVTKNVTVCHNFVAHKGIKGEGKYKGWRVLTKKRGLWSSMPFWLLHKYASCLKRRHHQICPRCGGVCYTTRNLRLLINPAKASWVWTHGKLNMYKTYANPSHVLEMTSFFLSGTVLSTYVEAAVVALIFDLFLNMLLLQELKKKNWEAAVRNMSVYTGM